MLPNDPSTGLPWGDHGTANEAIDWAVDYLVGVKGPFLRAWRIGDAARDWPGYYGWLRSRRGV